MTPRLARDDDCAAIASIWNGYIRDSLATFTSAEKTEAELRALLADKAAAGHGVFVVEAASAVCGFALYGQFRGGPGYAHTMEHSLLLDAGARGRGAGRALMAAIEADARAGGAHSMIAGVSAGNHDGVAFHAAIGYREVARLPQVGRKFGRWLDLVVMQKMLGGGPD